MQQISRDFEEVSDPANQLACTPFSAILTIDAGEANYVGHHAGHDTAVQGHAGGAAVTGNPLLPVPVLLFTQLTALQINKLEETVQELTDRLAEADLRQERVLKDKTAIIAMKDEEIADLKAKMDDMAEEFGEMLRETLEKMRERIEVSSGNFDGPDMLVQQRLEELKLNE